MTIREAISRIEALEQAQAQILAELRLLRRGQPRADANSIEALLAHLYDTFGTTSWTSAAVLEAAMDNPLLRGAVKHCVGENPTIYKLSLFLPQRLGQWGEYGLRCVEDHSRDGRLFVVIGSVTRSQSDDDRVDEA